MIEMYKKVVFQNYFNFSGRVRRKEYLAFILVHIILMSLLSKIDSVAKFHFSVNEMGVLGSVYSLIVLIPLIGATIRRMHDLGKSGWYALIPFYNIILMWTGGEEGTNQYGEDPIDEMEYLRELGKDLN